MEDKFHIVKSFFLCFNKQFDVPTFVTSIVPRSNIIAEEKLRNLFCDKKKMKKKKDLYSFNLLMPHLFNFSRFHKRQQ